MGGAAAASAINVSTIFLIIIAFLVVTGFLFGLLKGMARSIFSLGLVIVAFVVMVVFEKSIAHTVMTIDLGGQNIGQIITSAFSSEPELASLVDKILPLIEIIIGIVAFIVGFLLLYLVSRVIYFIGKFFIRPAKKNRLLGGVFGIVQGLLISFAICVPLNGVLHEVNKLSNVEIEGQQIISLDSIGYGNYENSVIDSLLSGVGGGFFKSISSVTTEDGTTITLSGQVDTVVTAVKIAESVSKINNVDMTDGLTNSSSTQIADILREVETIKGEASEEVIKTIDNLLETAIEAFDIPIDIPEFSLENINFENEAVLVETIFEISEAESIEEIENVDEVIEALSNSNLILPIVEVALEDSEISIPNEVKAELEASINKLSDAEKAQRLKDLFGIA